MTPLRMPGALRRTMRAVAIAPLLAAALVAPAAAQAPPQGTFFASRACPALQSIAKGTNPGNIRIEPDRPYPVVTGNKPEPTHYLLIVPGASPSRRWVAIDCGTFTATNGVTTPPHTRPVPTGQNKASRFRTDFVLALSWEPAFCESNDARPECRAEAAASAEAHQFSLHGLWPQPRTYCDVAPADVAADKTDRWHDLPQIMLRPETRAALDSAMPGTRSLLDRHEWIKHGTCADMSMQTYFSLALEMLAQVNGSAVRALFGQNIGKQLTIEQVRGAADSAFGPGSGARLAMNCDDADERTLITEVTIGLAGDVADADGDFSRLILAAAPAKSDCIAGIVDPAGNQAPSADR